MASCETDKNNQYLTFAMGSEIYALPVTNIREVLLVPTVTRIPRMPDFMRGVVNLRGSVVPIFDLKLRFGMGKTNITNESAIVVVEIPFADKEGSESIIHVGVYTDAVKKVITLSKDDIEAPPKIGMKISTSFIQGMGRADNDFIVILDVRELLTDDDLEQVEEAKGIVSEST